MTKKKIWLLVLIWAFAALWIAFIWGNSMQVGTESAEMSGTLAKILNAVLGNESEHFDTIHRFVRKAAHFTEYVILSLLFCFAFRLTQRKAERGIYIPPHRDFSLFALPASFTVAMADEGIQLFTDGRHGSMLDVLLDTCGALCALCIFFALMLTFQRKYRPRSKNP